jgi:hypothetical protein
VGFVGVKPEQERVEPLSKSSVPLAASLHAVVSVPSFLMDCEDIEATGMVPSRKLEEILRCIKLRAKLT